MLYISPIFPFSRINSTADTVSFTCKNDLIELPSPCIVNFLFSFNNFINFGINFSNISYKKSYHQ